MIKVTQNKPRTRRNIIVIAILVIILAGGASAYAFLQSSRQNDPSNPEKNGSSIDYEKPTEEQTNAGEETKNENINKTPEENETPSTPTINDNIRVTVNQFDSTLNVVTQLKKVDSSATCSLTLSSGSSTVDMGTVGIQELSSYATCRGWNIAIDDKLSSGTWLATVKVSSSSFNGSTTSEVVIR